MMKNHVLVEVAGRLAVLTLDELQAGYARADELLPEISPAAAAPEPVESLLDSRQLAELLGVGDTLLEAMAKGGRIPFFRIGRFLRFKKSEVEAALRPRDSESQRNVQPAEPKGRKRVCNRSATSGMRELSVDGIGPKGAV